MIHLKSITLEHFKRHRQFHTDFKPGLNLIVGPNYSGKTTIKEAILFALYGPTVVPGGKEVIQPVSGGKPKVTLVLQSDKDTVYTIERTLTAATLIRDGAAMARGVAEVSRAVSDLLEISKEQFLDLRHSNQGETSALLSFSGTELKALVERLAGVDTIDAILNHIAGAVRWHSGAQATLRAQLNGLPSTAEEDEAELASVSDRRDRYSHLQVFYKTKVEYLEGLVSDYRTDLEEAKEKHRLFVEAEQARSVARARMEEYEPIFRASRESADTWHKQIEVAELRLQASELELDDLQAKAGTLREAVQEAQARHDDYVRQQAYVRTLRNQFSVCLSELETLTAQSRREGHPEDLQRELEARKDQLAKDQALVNESRSLSQALDKLRTRVSSAQSKLDAVEELPVITQDIEQLRHEAVHSINRVWELAGEYDRKRQALADLICPECQRPYEGEDVTHLREAVWSLEAALKEATRYSEERKKLVDEHEKELKRYQHLSLLKEERQRILDQLTAEFSQGQAELEQLPMAMDEAMRVTLQAQVKELQVKVDWVTELEWKRDERVKQSTALQSQLNSLVVLEDRDPTPWLKELEEVQARVHTLEAEYNDARRMVLEAEEKLEEGSRVVARYFGLVSELNAIPVLEDAFPGPIEQFLEERRGELEETRSAFQRMKWNLEAVEETFKTVSERVKVRTSLEEQERNEIDRVDRLNRLSKLIKTNRDKFLSHIWEGLLSTASTFASTCTGGDIEDIGKTDNFDLFYSEQGRKMSFKAASGAQKSIIGLGLKLAMSRLMPCQAGFILLDEATADMRDDVSAMTEVALRETCPQVVSVTHRDLDQMSADWIISLEKRA